VRRPRPAPAPPSRPSADRRASRAQRDHVGLAACHDLLGLTRRRDHADDAWSRCRSRVDLLGDRHVVPGWSASHIGVHTAGGHIDVVEADLLHGGTHFTASSACQPRSTQSTPRRARLRDRSFVPRRDCRITSRLKLMRPLRSAAVAIVATVRDRRG
jgi:hypothetical protein